VSEEQYEGAAKVPAILQANTSPRYRRLEWLEAWVEGTQYEGKRDWFDDAVPLWERRPCIVYPAVSLAITSYVDLLFGETRLPTFTTKPDEDEADDEAGLGEEDSKTLDRFIAKHHKASGFRSYCRDGLAAAMGCGTAVGIHGHRNGKPFAELIPAKWCTPRLDHTGEVLDLEVRYPYVEEYKLPTGKWAVRVKLYRRTIDAKSDTTYFPADAHQDGAEPNWKANPALTVQHALGFCPVVWYPFMRGCQAVNVIDGKAIHALTTDEIHQHDVARSQWHRCSLLSEPQMCEMGVPPGYNPTSPGRPAIVPSTERGGRVTPDNPQRGGYLLGGTEGDARKKGPGYVNQYPDKETKVELLTTPAEALEAQHVNVSDLRLKVQEALCVVFLDPENIKFAATTSGKALEAIKQKQLDRCGIYRDDIDERWLQPSISMQLRIAQRVGKVLKVPLIKQALPILNKFAAESDGVAAS
jgi:hypothetical protein